MCLWLSGRDQYDEAAGLTFLEAVENGWWYSAPLPDKRRAVGFHTDSDLLPDSIDRTPAKFLMHAAKTIELSSLLRRTGFQPDGPPATICANSAKLETCAGKGWLAIGDAALSLDPLSSQGLFNSLFGALAGAEAADRYLAGHNSAPAEYGQLMDRIHLNYRRNLAFCYQLEKRWPASPFWKRRHAWRDQPGSPITNAESALIGSQFNS